MAGEHGRVSHHLMARNGENRKIRASSNDLQSSL